MTFEEHGQILRQLAIIEEQVRVMRELVAAIANASGLGTPAYAAIAVTCSTCGKPWSLGDGHRCGTERA